MIKTIHWVPFAILACGTPLIAAPREKQTRNPAIVFMVAGQSNAGGCGIFSPEMHGMELPVVYRLEKRFPDNDIYIIKHGPSGRNLHTDWNPSREGGHYARFLDSSRKGLAQLAKEYPEVRVIGLYWDQG